MREIKFRGKRKDTGEWVHGYYAIHHISLTDIDRKTNQEIRVGTKTVHSIFNDEKKNEIGYWKDVDSKTVGQFTGLHDKNGKEIYEGDIIDFGLNAVVKYHPFLCSFILDCDNREPHLNDSYSELGFMEKTSKKFVVIGNIHDTPELLK